MRPDSNNTGWRDAAFKGYADYIETDDLIAINNIENRAIEHLVLLLCALGLFGEWFYAKK